MKIGGRREVAPTEAAGGDCGNRCRGAVQVADRFVTGNAKNARLRIIGEMRSGGVGLFSRSLSTKRFRASA